MIKEFIIQNITNILIYLAIINVIGFLSMGFDKFKANFSLHLTLGCHCPEGDSNVIHMRSRIKMICLSGIT